MRISLWAAAVLVAALILPAPTSAVLIIAPPPQSPLCRVTAQALPTLTPGIYRVRWQVRPECAPNGVAYVRLESGRVYPWQEVRPGQPVTSRPIPWYWRSVWRAASGKTYEIPVPGLRAPWERP